MDACICHVTGVHLLHPQFCKKMCFKACASYSAPPEMSFSTSDFLAAFMTLVIAISCILHKRPDFETLRQRLARPFNQIPWRPKYGVGNLKFARVIVWWVKYYCSSPWYLWRIMIQAWPFLVGDIQRYSFTHLGTDTIFNWLILQIFQAYPMKNSPMKTNN